MSTTITQIARSLGISHAVVSKALNGGKNNVGVSQATRQRILNTAKKMGYRPNTAAKAMGRGRFGCVSLLLSNDPARSNLPEGLLRGVHDESARHNLHLNITRLPDAQLTSEGFVPKVLRESMADGMLVNYTHDIPARMLDLIKTHHAPAVWINSDLPVDCVRPDDEGGAARLTEHLLSRGHRRIVYTKLDASAHYSREARRRGYERVMQAAGLPPCVIDRRVSGSEQLEVARALLTGPDRATAVIVRPEDAALFAVAAVSLGLRMPEDVSLASIASQPFELLGLGVTCVSVPAIAEGVAAVEMIRRKIEAPMEELPPVVIPFEFFAGATVVAPVPS